MEEKDENNNDEKKGDSIWWGIISDEYYSGEDSIQTLQLIKILRDDYDQFESEARSNLRQEVLGMLNKILREWIKEAALSEGKDEITASRAGGQIFTFGSYSLGVHGPNTDIDTLCVAPRFVDRDKHFFGTLVEILKKNPEVTELCPVPYTKVPIIKMKFRDIDIDLLFARISAPIISEDLKSLQDDSILK